MFYLIWQMGLFLLIAFGLGLLFGRQIWSGDARSAEADAALADVERLRRENENLARRLGDCEVRASEPAAKAEPVETVKTGAAAMPDTAPEPVNVPEPVVAPEPQPVPVAETPPEPVKAADGEAEDLTAIKGLGPKAAAALIEGGVTRIDQIAAWSPSDIADWDARINGRGRIMRDDWVGQAKTLAGR